MYLQFYSFTQLPHTHAHILRGYLTLVQIYYLYICIYMCIYIYLVFTHAYTQLVPVGRRQELLHYSQEMWWK